MRDAFGGTFMIQIFIVFILVYISFTALALNYAKAFKAKNMIIEYLENNEIMDLSSNVNEYNDMKQTFEKEILSGLNYKANTNVCKEAQSKTYYCDDIGFEIKRTGEAENTEGIYYTVSTYVGWDLGFLNAILAIGNKDSEHVPGYWKITGQTRLIYKED